MAMTEFNSYEGFLSALDEVEILLVFAENHQRDAKTYAVLVKSALLFLASKFEAFLEDLLEEYSFKINELRLPAGRLPLNLKLCTVDCLVDEQFIAGVRRHEQTSVRTLERLAHLWHPTAVIDCVEVKAKFSYGRHGEGEIIRLFRQAGIEDVFNACVVSEPHESMVDQTGDMRIVDIRADVNSVTGLRNNILHEDATPNLTHSQVDEFRRHLISFSRGLVEQLRKQLQELATE